MSFVFILSVLSLFVFLVGMVMFYKHSVYLCMCIIYIIYIIYVYIPHKININVTCFNNVSLYFNQQVHGNGQCGLMIVVLQYTVYVFVYIYMSI